jgi:predicted PurR-regulated permease PerM
MNTLMKGDLVRTILQVLVIAALVVTSLWIISPFLPAMVWATMIVVATWPLFLGLEARLWGRRGLAISVMTIAILLVLFVPMSLAIGALIDNADAAVAFGKRIAHEGLPHLPASIEQWPLIGEPITKAWDGVLELGLTDLWKRVAPYLGQTAKFLASQAGSFGLVAVHFILTAVIAALLYAYGEGAAQAVQRFVSRLAGASGEASVVLAGQAIRAVAMGIVVTALIQSAVGGVGLLIAGVPHVSILAALMFMFCIAQIGPGLVLFPVVAWMYWGGDSGWATFLLVWSIGTVSMDNFLRPILIRRGADLPLMLIFAGVIGGLLAMGLIGLFVGPVVLAVTFRLAQAWINEGLPQAAAAVQGSRAPDRGSSAA